MGAVATRVVSFLGAAARGEIRIVWPFKLSSDGVLVSSAAEDTGEGIRTVSRFTAGASPIFEGRVMRTVSFFGIAVGGVPEGVSSAIIIEFSKIYLIAGN
jgi:hypothetical protein